MMVMGAVAMTRRLLMVAGVGAALGAAPVAVDAALVRLKTGAAEDDIVAALREARALALSRGHPVRVLVDERMRTISVEGGRWRKLPDGVTLAGPPANRGGQGVIAFAADGSSGGGQIVVGWRDWAVSVLVDGASGQVRRVRASVFRPAGASARPGNAG